MSRSLHVFRPPGIWKVSVALINGKDGRSIWLTCEKGWNKPGSTLGSWEAAEGSNSSQEYQLCAEEKMWFVVRGGERGNKKWWVVIWTSEGRRPMRMQAWWLLTFISSYFFRCFCQHFQAMKDQLVKHTPHSQNSFHSNIKIDKYD